MRVPTTWIAPPTSSITLLLSCILSSLATSWATSSSGWMTKSILRSSGVSTAPLVQSPRERTLAILHSMPKRSASNAARMLTASSSETAMR